MSSDEAYVLAYAVILLNTTLHNANAKGQNFGLADERTFVRTMLDYDDQTELSEDLVRVGFQKTCYLYHPTSPSHCISVLEANFSLHKFGRYRFDLRST